MPLYSLINSTPEIVELGHGPIRHPLPRTHNLSHHRQPIRDSNAKRLTTRTPGLTIYKSGYTLKSTVTTRNIHRLDLDTERAMNMATPLYKVMVQRHAPGNRKNTGLKAHWDAIYNSF